MMEEKVLKVDKNKEIDELKVIHWNINNRRMIDTPIMIATAIGKENADIVVLTEFLKTPNYNKIVEGLEDFGYKVFLDNRKHKKNIMQVLIAVKSNLITEEDCIKAEILYDNEENIFAEIKANEHFEDILKKQNPNFLRVDIKLTINNHSYPLTIIGTRIRVGMKKNSDDLQTNRENEQKFRKSQFENLLIEINNSRKENENIIVVGDFNISPGYEGHYWNWKDFKQLLKEKNYNLYSPKNGYSPFESTWKLDHLIASDTINCKFIEYHKDKWPKGENYPDHSILRATIQL